MLGSAMLGVEYQGLSLLYTGDFRLGASSTAEPAQVPPADILVMESTYGDPRYRMPPRGEVVEALIHTVRTILQSGSVPVIQVYVSGKCQEVVRLLWDHGIPAQQHPAMAAISGIYQECGIELGPIVTYSGDALPGHVVMEPPPGQRRARRLPIPREAMTIAVTGWALDERARYRMGVDYAFPLTDHADYSELLQCIEMVRPRTVYCTHGPLGFARHLRELGHDAHPLNSARLAVSR
jgi:Cft2 family RNA processing exonuclease